MKVFTIVFSIPVSTAELVVIQVNVSTLQDVLWYSNNNTSKYSFLHSITYTQHVLQYRVCTECKNLCSV